MFQHTAARRRLGSVPIQHIRVGDVSTHSRPKAAGYGLGLPNLTANVSTHSRPKAAGDFQTALNPNAFCFNTQPPEGGWRHLLGFSDDDLVSTHSRPKAAG